MTCSANKKSHTLYGAWLACRSHATIQVHLGHILDISWTNNAGSDKVLCLSPPETLSVYGRVTSAIRQDGAVRTHLFIYSVVKFYLTTQDGSCGTLSPPSGHTSPPCLRHASLLGSPGTCVPTSVWFSHPLRSTCPRLSGSSRACTPCPQAPSVPWRWHQATSPSSCRDSPLPASRISAVPPSVLPFLPLLPK